MQKQQPFEPSSLAALAATVECSAELQLEPTKAVATAIKRPTKLVYQVHQLPPLKPITHSDLELTELIEIHHTYFQNHLVIIIGH